MSWIVESGQGLPGIGNAGTSPISKAMDIDVVRKFPRLVFSFYTNITKIYWSLSCIWWLRKQKFVMFLHVHIYKFQILTELMFKLKGKELLGSRLVNRKWSRISSTRLKNSDEVSVKFEFDRSTSSYLSTKKRTENSLTDFNEFLTQNPHFPVQNYRFSSGDLERWPVIIPPEVTPRKFLQAFYSTRVLRHTFLLHKEDTPHMIYSTWKFLHINITPQESTPHKHYATLYSINSGNSIRV